MNTEEGLQSRKRAPTTRESRADDSSDINLTEEEEDNDNLMKRTNKARRMTNNSDSLKSLNDIKESDDEQSMSLSSHDHEVQ